MRRFAIPLLVLVVALAAPACGDNPSTGEVTEPVVVDRTNPLAVALAWLRAWCVGEGGHVEYEFETVPTSDAGLGATLPGDLPQGTPVAAFVSASSGIGGRAEPPRFGFDLETYSLPTTMRKRAVVSTESARAVRYTVRLRLEDESEHGVNVHVRPEGSFDQHVTATKDTRWRVVHQKATR